MTWQEVLERKELQDLPFKIELDSDGKLELSPRTNLQGFLKANLGYLLSKHLENGGCLHSCSVLTTQNVKVADVVWASNAFLKTHLNSDPFLLRQKFVWRSSVQVTQPKKFSRKLVCT